jgi:N-acetylmuramoyl-L-alanine amidase
VVSKKKDPNLTEAKLASDVSQNLKKMLEKEGFQCSITGNGSKKTSLSKDKADFSIFINSDDTEKSKDATGAFALYPRVGDKSSIDNSKKLATDILKYYNVVAVENNSAQQEEGKGINVLGSSNLTPNKIQLVLGDISNPRDAKALFSNKEKIAE